MRAWILAFGFGLTGVVLGTFATHAAGVNSQQPLWCLAGGVWFAILGAVLGGTSDIVEAIRSSK